MKIKVKLDNAFKVQDIERDSTTPDWIQDYKLKNQAKLPSLPKWLYPLLNIRDEKGYRSLEKSNEDLLVSNQLEVIPISGQQSQLMTADKRNQLLELVEFTGKDAGDYVRSFEVMYPKNPNFFKG